MNKKVKNKQGSVAMSNNGKAAIFTLGFCYLFVIAEITYKIKVAHEVCTWEIILLFLMLSVYGIFQKLFSKSEVPLDFKGNPLPTGYTKPEKKTRNAFYRLNALIYAVIFAVVVAVAFISSSMISNVNIGSELLFDTELPNFVFGIIAAVILFPIVYLFSLMVEYVWYEYKISQYNTLVIIREEQANKELSPEEEIESSTENTLDSDSISLKERLGALFAKKDKAPDNKETAKTE